MMTATPLMTDEAAIALCRSKRQMQSGGVGTTRHTGSRQSCSTRSLSGIHVAVRDVAATQGAECAIESSTMCTSNLTLCKPYATMHVNQIPDLHMKPKTKDHLSSSIQCLVTDMIRLDRGTIRLLYR